MRGDDKGSKKGRNVLLGSLVGFLLRIANFAARLIGDVLVSSR